jgi:hypothetical protein
MKTAMPLGLPWYDTEEIGGDYMNNLTPEQLEGR